MFGLPIRSVMEPRKLVVASPQTSVREAWTQVSSIPYPNEDPLFQGGPCEGPLIVLHKEADRGQMEVLDGIYLSSDADAVKALVDEVAEPVKFFVGYAGWGSGQLESELQAGAWTSTAATAQRIFHNLNEMWETITRELGGTRLWETLGIKHVPSDPRMN